MAGDNTLNIVPTVQQDPNELVVTSMPSAGLTEGIAADRANRYKSALGDTIVPDSIDDLTKRLIATSDENLRRDFMAVDEFNRKQKVQQDVANMIQTKQNTNQGFGIMDIAKIHDLNSTVPYSSELPNPYTYVEKKLAMRDLSIMAPGGIVVDDVSLDDGQPESTIPAVDPSTDPANKPYLDQIARNYIVQNTIENFAARYEKESWASWTWNFLPTMIPGRVPYGETNVVQGANADTLMPAANIDQNLDYLYSLPPDQFELKLNETLQTMYDTNPVIAMMFAGKILNFTQTDRAFTNIFAGLDAGTIVTEGLKAGVGVGVALKLNSMRNAVKQGTTRGGSIPGLLDGTGQTLDAALGNIRNSFLASTTRGGVDTGSLGTLRNSIPSILDVDAFLGPAGTTPYSALETARLSDAIKSQAGGLMDVALLQPQNIARLERGSGEYQAAAATAQDVLTNLYPGIANKIQSVEIVPASETTTNAMIVKLAIGKENGGLYPSEASARSAARFLKLKDTGYQVEPRGNSFAITLSAPVSETDDSVRAALKHTVDTVDSTPSGWWRNSFWGKVRTADELLPKTLNTQIKTATYGAGPLSEFSTAVMQSAVDVKNVSKKEFMRFIEDQRVRFNPLTRETGYWSKDIPTFVNDWSAMYGRLPNVDETLAYATYRQVNDIEYAQRILNITGGKLRKGVMMHRIPVKGGLSRPFEGAVLKDVPWDKGGDFGVVVIGDKGKTVSYVRSKFSSAKANPEKGTPGRNDITDLIVNQGYKVIQVPKWGEDALRETANLNLPQGSFRYLVVKETKAGPLPSTPIEYRGSGHMAYAHDNMISQPRLSSYKEAGATYHEYHGDNTLFIQPTAADAKAVTADLEKARVLLLNKDKQGLKNFLARSRIPMPYSDFVRLFKGVNKKFDVNVPFYARTRGSTVYDIHAVDMNKRFANISDARKDPHNLYHDDLNLQYALERDAPARRSINIGTPNVPIYSVAPANLIDAMTTMEQSSKQMARAKYLDDIKIKAGERFVQEFGRFVDMSPEDLRNYPMRALDPKTPFIKPSAVPANEIAAYNAAKNYRHTVNQFAGVLNDDQLVARSVNNALHEFMASRFGDTVADRVMSPLGETIKGVARDPLQKIRNFAFHLKLGLWNPKQVFMQGQGILQTTALEGATNAYRGASLWYLTKHLEGYGSTADIRASAKLAQKEGWNAKHFVEAYEALRDSGFWKVGREYGQWSNFVDSRIVSSKLGKVAEHGLFFFQGGEGFNRVSAYGAAYSSWRAKNPIAAFDDIARQKVLERADLLTNNMSRASNASWNTGWASIPTQFWSFHARMADLMLGTRLTPKERFAMMAMYSAMYGLPAGTLGLHAGAVIPAVDATREALQQMGITPNDNVLTDLLVNGVPQAALGMLYGGEAPDLSGFGPNGNGNIKDILEALIPGGAKGNIESALGPAGKVALHTTTMMLQALGNAVFTFSGSQNMVLKTYLGVNQGKYSLDYNTLAPILNEVSSLSNGAKAYMALMYGNYWARNNPDRLIYQHKDEEGHATSAPMMSALSTLLLGTTPVDVSKTYVKQNYLEAVKEAKQLARDRMESAYRKMFTAESSQDFVKYAKEAQAWSVPLDPFDKTKVLMEAAKKLPKSYADKLDEQMERFDRTKPLLDLNAGSQD